MAVQNIAQALEHLVPDTAQDLARFNQCTFGIQHFHGTGQWSRHPAGDDLVYVVSGDFEVTMLIGRQKETVAVPTGSAIIVPKGVWHRAYSHEGAAVFFVTPREGTQTSVEDPKI